jgi:multicomponent Na+:H+ antiporter subunit E
VTARLATRLPVIAGLTVVWALLWGAFTPLVLVGGALVALLVTSVFPFPAVPRTGRFRPWPAVVLVVVFLVEMLVASVQVAWIAIRPARPPRSAVIQVDLVTRSEFLLTITSELICLVPGSLLVELDSAHGRLWLHLLDGSTPEKIEGARVHALAQERRVVAALGSAAELAACQSGAHT